MMRIENLTAQYQTITGPVVSVKDVHFNIRDDEVFGIAGESGCGKSTLLKVMYDTLAYPLEIKSGKVVLDYADAGGARHTLESGQISRAWWDAVSYVPQAAMSVLNPVYRIEDQFYELFRRHRKGQPKAAMLARLTEYLSELSLPIDILKSYPHQLSGGMRQRVVIAMATFLGPGMIFADEPTTALDVVVQKSILMMLMELQKKMKNTLVIVSHDMGVHYQITNRMGIMYSGSMVELGDTRDLFESPMHPYTQMLIGALPKVGDHSDREGIPGSPPSLRNPPPGCRFAPRCKNAIPSCSEAVPRFEEVAPGRYAACHLLPKTGKAG
ncbi:MAG: ABC transporter ATP-binding protein [Christensenellales bacterium]|jgi:peptide/nickel transport system ATP-binding protein